MTRGLPIFLAACVVIAALIVIPPEHGRWIALALLVLVALTPAVGQSKPRPKARRVSRSEKASSAMRS